jgi:uncharacterized protein (DUF2164 family)
VKIKPIKDIEEVSSRYILKRIEFLTEDDLQVSVDASRLYLDFDISLVKNNFETEIFINKINSRLGILFNNELLKLDKNKKYSLSQKGKDYLKPFYKKIPWWGLIIALIGLTPFLVNWLLKE